MISPCPPVATPALARFRPAVTGRRPAATRICPYARSLSPPPAVLMVTERAAASPCTDLAVAAVRMAMPSPSKTSSMAADTSGSSKGASRSSASETVTRVPSRANSCAISRPTAFPPITSIDSGSSVSSIAVVEVRYPAPASPLIVRAENLVRGCDQQSCSPGRPAVMITDHVPAVRLPPDHTDGLMAAAVPARGSVAGRRDPAPAPPAHRPATAAATPPEPGLGRPGTARDLARSDTESAAPGAAAAGHTRHDPALAPRYRPLPLGRQIHTRQHPLASHPPEH